MVSTLIIQACAFLITSLIVYSCWTIHFLSTLFVSAVFLFTSSPNQFVSNPWTKACKPFEESMCLFSVLKACKPFIESTVKAFSSVCEPFCHPTFSRVHLNMHYPPSASGWGGRRGNCKLRWIAIHLRIIGDPLLRRGKHFIDKDFVNMHGGRKGL